MISYSTLFLFFIFSCFFLFSIWPLLSDRISNNLENFDILNDLERRKSILYREIQYLDNEYYTQKINIDDYNTSRTELVREVSEIIDKINSSLNNQ
ncbi:MAG: hypothetical protein CMG37_04365 [Candidatus Marinimicrobia bacterium]|nr:hypothetical protein [Candidatus Neomarinimicrobiota bacterium]MBS00634.1 hypothetical protein [Candidatus Neomarinimicrobiota bacterium]MED5256951.1 hypothetical protein [Candidatus Neomarinimicrobiota bacterium]MED5266910.1 hypothetical protein [Candidatus Neomarinimicrobiota bacterium]|tara:strand:+ start:48 stop:335 length:288 start_codon:yes stop_codon:yes gene_type:complete